MGINYYLHTLGKGIVYVEYYLENKISYVHNIVRVHKTSRNKSKQTVKASKQKPMGQLENNTTNTRQIPIRHFPNEFDLFQWPTARFSRSCYRAIRGSR